MNAAFKTDTSESYWKYFITNKSIEILHTNYMLSIERILDIYVTIYILIYYTIYAYLELNYIINYYFTE